MASERSASAHHSHILPKSTRRAILYLSVRCFGSSIRLHDKFTFCIYPAVFFKGRNGQRFGRLKMGGDLMTAQEPTISSAGLEFIAAVQQSAVVEMRALRRMR